MFGAALAVAAWALASVGFSIYLAQFADYGVTYGSIGAAVGLLVYLDLTASLVLAGAEFNAAIHHSAAERMSRDHSAGGVRRGAQRRS
jgi:membrane protein